MAKRPEKSTEYIRHTFTSEERLTMGDELAQAHNRMEDITDEETVIKAQLKEKKSQVESTVSRLSRELANGFTMKNVECRLEWDKPNVNEVSYIRIDTGDCIKTRPFTESERQQDLPLAGEVVFVPAEESAENIAAHFGVDDEWADQTCESGQDDCGPVTHHDVDGVPMCTRCWEGGIEDDKKKRETKKEKEAKAVRNATIKLQKL